jgi:hypothetical protein
VSKHARYACAILIFLGGTVARPDGPIARWQFWYRHHEPATAATAQEAFLGTVASEIAGRSVSVRCADLGDGAAEEPGGRVGFVGTKPLDYAELRPDVCRRLLVLQRTPSPPQTCSYGMTDPVCGRWVDDAAEALTVLAHESYHLHGVRDEAATECYAHQWVRDVAMEFRVSARVADALADYAYTVQYPRMPDDYRSAECRAGGALDLGRWRWPRA